MYQQAKHFQVPGSCRDVGQKVLGFTAAVDRTQGATRLIIIATILGKTDAALNRALHEALDAVPAIERLKRYKGLTVSVTAVTNENAIAPRAVKRTITELGDEQGTQDDLSRTARQNTAV